MNDAPRLGAGLPATAAGRVSALGWLLRILLAGYFACALGLMVMRHWVLPNADTYRAEIASAVGEALGLPVSIGRVSAQWSGLHPALQLVEVSISDGHGRSALGLGRVDATLSWASLARGRLLFRRIEILAPELAIRREVDGRVLVAGLELGGGEQRGGFGEWLLAQPEIRIHDATVMWSDLQRGAPPLVLAALEFRLENRGERHRFGFTAAPQPGLAESIDVRGELRLTDSAQWQQGRGELYVRLDQAELGAWQSWVDYPVPLAGRGAAAAWLQFEGPGIYGGRVDLALDQARTRLRADLPELALARLEGSIRARRSNRVLRIETRQLSLAGDSGIAVPGLDLRLDLARDESGAAVAGGFSANHLDLAALAALAAHLPLDPVVLERLSRLAPSGTVHDLQLSWRGPLEAPGEWQVEGRAAGLGLAASAGWPGVAGLSGSFAGDREAGSFTIAAQDAALDLPMVFVDPRLPLSTLEAKGRWLRREQQLEIHLDQARFENPDAAGSAEGWYRPIAGGPGEIALEARLSRGDGRAVWRYLPRVINDSTRNWLRGALVAGGSSDARLSLKGKLRDFPFAGRGPGQFLVTVKVDGARLDYAPGWPAIHDIAGELRFEGNGMYISAARGRIGEATLADVSAEIPDLAHADEILTVRGSAHGSTRSFLDFVAASPVAARINHFTDEIRAEGAGGLELRLDLPLRRIAQSKVKGEYRFSGNTLHLFTGLPELRDASARIQFTGDSLAIADGSARLLGEPITVRGATAADGALLIRGSGTAAAAALRSYSGEPLLDHLSGRAAWTTEIEVRGRTGQVRVDSDLSGVASSLPPPLNKSASQRMPLKVALDLDDAGAAQHWRVALDTTMHGELSRSREPGGGWRIGSGGVSAGAPLQLAPSGVMASIDWPELDLDAWRALLPARAAGAASRSGAAPVLAEVALRSGRVKLFDEWFSAVDFKARADAGGWRGQIASEAIAGEFDWRSRDQGSLKAHFSRLALRSASSAPELAGPPPPLDDPLSSLPALEIDADRFLLRGMELGALRLLARNQEGEWWLDSLRLSSPQGEMNGSGRWRPGVATHLDLSASFSDVGAWLARIGYADAVHKGNAELVAEVGWKGPPTEVDYPSLDGKLALEASDGQFKKLEPGVGRLLGVLSLQALPRRITLDFRDVFSEGFAFDRIEGKATLSAGILSTEAFAIRGPAARVRLDGTVDLAGETQDLLVSVQPTLSESVAVGAAFANAATGLINPVAGVVTYIAQKILQDPVERLFSYQYKVSGNWDEPKVEKASLAAFRAEAAAPPTEPPGAAAQ